MVVGLNHRTASLSMRERFWISDARRYEALRHLESAEGIEEVLILSTCCRTEFLVWASEPTLAANSLVHYLSTQHGLRLSEWEHFYRRLDDDALTHIFRVASGLDSRPLCGSEVVSQLQVAWQQARAMNATGPYLNAVLEKAFEVSERVRREASSIASTISIPEATLDLASRVFGSVERRHVLLLGAAALSERAGRLMMGNGAASVVVIDESQARAQELADKLGCSAASFAERWTRLLKADIVISASGCPHVIFTREEAERIAAERNRVALLVIDIDMPRDVDPEVRRVDGILLYDIDGLERQFMSDHETAENLEESSSAAAEAERIVAAEVAGFRGKLEAENALPTAVCLRRRLEQICRQELESFIEEQGPFTRELVQCLHASVLQVSQKIANSLARELKELPEKEQQEQMTAAVTRLFHLDSPNLALAGAKSKEESDDSTRKHPIAINY